VRLSRKKKGCEGEEGGVGLDRDVVVFGGSGSPFYQSKKGPFKERDENGDSAPGWKDQGRGVYVAWS